MEVGVSRHFAWVLRMGVLFGFAGVCLLLCLRFVCRWEERVKEQEERGSLVNAMDGLGLI